MLLAMVDEHHRDRGSSDLGKVNVWSPRIVCQNMPKQSKLLKQFEHVICAQNPWYFRSYRLFDRDPCNGLNIYQNLYKTKSNWIVFYPRVWTKYDETTRNGCSCLSLGYNMAAQNYYYIMFLSTWFHTIPLRCIKLSESIPSYQIAVYHLLWILQRARLEHLPWLKHHRTIQICAPPKHICTPALINLIMYNIFRWQQTHLTVFHALAYQQVEHLNIFGSGLRLGLPAQHIDLCQTWSAWNTSRNLLFNFIFEEISRNVGTCWQQKIGVSKNRRTPKSSILMAFSLQTIHFGVLLLLETPKSIGDTVSHAKHTLKSSPFHFCLWNLPLQRDLQSESTITEIYIYIPSMYGTYNYLHMYHTNQPWTVWVYYRFNFFQPGTSHCCPIFSMSWKLMGKLALWVVLLFRTAMVSQLKRR